MSDYFRLPHPGWMAAILFGLYLLTHSAFCPETIPSLLGPVGQFGKYLGTEHPVFIFSLFVVTVIIHVAEAVYTVSLCSQKKLSTTATIKWSMSTLVFGFSSLIRLKPYKPRTE